jgi:hypothetical protein
MRSFRGRPMRLSRTHFDGSSLNRVSFSHCLPKKFKEYIVIGSNTVNLHDELVKIFKDWGSELNSAERKALEKKVSGRSVSSWKADHITMVAASGFATGFMGGPVGLAAILPDLLWCKKVGIQGCLGIGHILGRDVDYDEDMNYILGIWTELVGATVAVPVGKVGMKVSNKATVKVAEKLAVKIIEKSATKGGSKFLAKLAAKGASKAAAKLSAKLLAKTGVGWIPLVGGAASGGINWWLLNELLNAAEKYYTKDYIIPLDSELGAELRV